MRIVSQFLFKSLCLAAASCVAGAAQAGIAVYTNQADFLSAIAAPGTDTFDDLAAGAYGNTVYRTAGAYDYRADSAGGLWGAGGPSDYWLSNNDRVRPIVFSGFSGGVNAFGGNFFASGVGGDYMPDGTIVLTAADGGTLTYDLTGATTASFVGFLSSAPLSSVSIGAGGVDYWPTANNVVLAVPEPAAYGMLLAGMSLLGVTARRRRG